MNIKNCYWISTGMKGWIDFDKPETIVLQDCNRVISGFMFNGPCCGDYYFLQESEFITEEKLRESLISWFKKNSENNNFVDFMISAFPISQLVSYAKENENE